MPLVFHFCFVYEMAKVVLHIYDITNSSSEKTNLTILRINRFMRDGVGLGGIFHGAIEVYGQEWSYGYCPIGTGVYSCPPRSNPMYSWRETIELGLTTLEKSTVDILIQRFSAQWMGRDYNLLQRNCNHFCDEFSVKLGTGNIPAWVNRFANYGESVADFAAASANQITNFQSSIYSVGQAAYRCFWSSPDSTPTSLIPQSDVERLFSDSNVRSESSLEVPDGPSSVLPSLWSLLGKNVREESEDSMSSGSDASRPN